MAHNLNRKKQHNGTSLITSLTIASIIIGGFVFLAFHAHIQLGVEQENTKLFISNQIHKFEVRVALACLSRVTVELTIFITLRKQLLAK